MSDGPRLEETLVQVVAQSATVCVDVRADKKRWLFYFEEGELVYSRSNLKSEQLESLRAGHPTLGEAALLIFQAGRRIRNAARSDGAEWKSREGMDPPERAPVPVWKALFAGLRAARDEAELMEAATDLLTGYPKTVQRIGDMGVSLELGSYLQRLDGARPGLEVLDFAPGPRADVLAALWVAWKAGALDISPHTVDPMNVRNAEPAVVLPPPEPADLAPVPKASHPAPPADPPPVVSPSTHEVSLPGRASVPQPIPDPTPMATATPVDPRAMALRDLAERIHAAENHFEVLQISWEASDEVYREAHRELVTRLHPDKYVGLPDDVQVLAADAFDRVRVAWEALERKENREKYIGHVIHGEPDENEAAMEQVKLWYEAEGEFKRGLVAFQNGRIRASHELFQTAVQKAPDELEYRAYLGFTTFKAHIKNDRERAQEGAAMLKDVLEKNKKQERQLDTAWVLMGRMHRASGNPDKARKCFIKALRINPANSDATLEMRRLGLAKKEKAAKKGFFAGLFGRGKDKKK